MDWIKVEDSEIVVRDQRTYEEVDDDSGDDPLAPGNVTSTNGETAATSRGEKRKSKMSTNDLYNNIKNRRKVVKRIASGLRMELSILERRRKDIHGEFMQLKALNEYYKKLELSVLQIRKKPTK